MANSCSLDVYIRDKNNEVAQSELWKSLKKHSKSREAAKRNYAIASDSNYVSKLQEEGVDVKFDKNGEMTFGTFRKLPISDITDEALLKSLNEEIKAGNYDYEDAVTKVQDFNRNEDYNKDFLAVLIRNPDGKYAVSVVKNNSTNRHMLFKQIRNRSLRDQIIYQLREAGVSVEFLENDEHYSGRYSTENVQMAANGLYALIHIGKGENVDAVLAEEAGHFAVGSLGESPLVKRLLKALTPEVQKKILGERYEEKELGKNPAREIAGRLVGQSLIKQGSQTVWGRLADRIANLAKSIFATFTHNTVLQAELEAERIANKIAYGFMAEEQQGTLENALSVQETLYNTKFINIAKFLSLVKALENTAQNLEILSKQGSNTIGSSVVDALKELIISATSGRYETLGDTKHYTQDELDRNALQGIAIIVSELTKMLGDQEGGMLKLLESITFDIPTIEGTAKAIAHNGNILRQAHTFYENLAVVTEIVSGALMEVGVKEKLSGTETTIFTKDNGAVVVNLKDLYQGLSTIESQFRDELFAKERAYFLSVLRMVLGRDYVDQAAAIIFKKYVNQYVDRINGKSNRKEYKLLEDIKYKLERGRPLNKKELSLLEKLNIKDLYENSQGDYKPLFDQIAIRVRELEQHGHRTPQGVKYRLERQGNRKIPLEELIDTLEDDPGWLGTFFRSMSNNTDVIGVIIDKFNKEAQLKSTQEVNQIWDKLKILQKRFKAIKGVSEKDLYEQWEDGSLTGNYITKYHYGQYNKDYKEFLAEQKKKFLTAFTISYVDSLSPFEKAYAWEQFLLPALEEWHKQHSELNEETGQYHPNESYRNKKFDKLMENSEFRSWYNDFMRIKRYCDQLCDNHMPFYRAPQFKGAFINRLANGQHLSNKGRVILNKLTANFCEDAEDRDFGSDLTATDPGDNDFSRDRDLVRTVPLFGINPLTHVEDMSTNPFGSMLAYAAMASNYSKLTTVADALSIGSEVLKKRRYGGKPDKGHTNTFKRYEKFLNRQVLGIASGKNVLSFQGKHVIAQKIATALNSFGSMLFLAGNIVGGMINTGTGFLENLKEAISGEYFNMKDLIEAHGIYAWSFVPNWLQFGRKSKDDKVNLFIRNLDILHSNAQHYREWRRIGLSNFIDAITDLVIWSPYSTGDHYMQTVIYIALAKHTKIFDKNGKQISLWDALTVEDNTNNDYDEITKIIDKIKESPSVELTPKEVAYIQKIAHLDEPTYTLSDMYKRYPPEVILHRLMAYQRRFSSNSSFNPEKPPRIYKQIQELIDKFQNEPDTAILTHQDRYLLMQAKVPVERKESLEQLLRESPGDIKASTLLKRLEKIRKLCHSGKRLVIQEGCTRDPNAYEAKEWLDNAYNKIQNDIPLTEEEKEMLLSININVEGLNKNDALYMIQERTRDLFVTDRTWLEFKMKGQEIGLRNHGIYNSQDYSLIQSTFWGKLLSALKGYAFGMIEKSWGSMHYSEALGHDTEGFRMTSLKLFISLLQGKRDFDDMSRWRKVLALVFPFFCENRVVQAGFSHHQYKNLQRTWVAQALILALRLLVGMLGPDDDEKEELKQLKTKMAALKRKKNKTDEDWALYKAYNDAIQERRQQPRFFLYYMAQRLLWEQSAFATAEAMLKNRYNLLDLTPVGIAAVTEVGTLMWRAAGDAILTDYYKMPYKEYMAYQKSFEDYTKEMDKKYKEDYPDGNYPYTENELSMLYYFNKQVSDSWIYKDFKVLGWDFGLLDLFPTSKIFYQQAQEGKYEKYDPKWKFQLRKYTPVLRNKHILEDPVTAFDNYMYGQTVKAR